LDEDERDEFDEGNEEHRGPASIDENIEGELNAALPEPTDEDESSQEPG
jgi:hypothetical protein